MCCGSMYTWPMRNRFAYSGLAKFSVTEVALLAVALVTVGAPEVYSAGCALIMLNVNATSLAENGLPSFHFTPARTGMVSVLPPLDQVGAPEASMGTGGWVGLTLFQMYNGSL